MAITYDPSVIEQFAQRLYWRARIIVLQYAVLGFLVLAGAVYFVFEMNRQPLGAAELMVVGAAGALIGFLIGREKSFNLRLQAQTALCQMQIEKNTRGSGVSAMAS